MQSQFERELLKTLKSIDGTLKRIEKSMNDEEKQHTTICNAVCGRMMMLKEDYNEEKLIEAWNRRANDGKND